MTLSAETVAVLKGGEQRKITARQIAHDHSVGYDMWAPTAAGPVASYVGEADARKFALVNELADVAIAADELLDEINWQARVLLLDAPLHKLRNALTKLEQERKNNDHQV